MPEFFQTPMGKKYYEHTMPVIAQSLERIAKKMDIDPEGIAITDDAVYISDSHGEIVSWMMEEWVDDPYITFSIANAILIYLSQGPHKLRKALNKSI